MLALACTAAWCHATGQSHLLRTKQPGRHGPFHLLILLLLLCLGCLCSRGGVHRKPPLPLPQQRLHGGPGWRLGSLAN